MSREATTLNTWPIALTHAVTSAGHDGQALLLRAGIDPQGLSDPNGRTPVRAMARLWRLAVEATEDPCFGLRVAAFIQPATFHSLGLALLASQNLEEALLRSARFSRIVSNAADVRIEKTESGIKQVVRWRAEVPVVDEGIDLLMASTVKMGMLLMGLDARTPPPLELHLKRSATDAMRADFERHFACPIQFEADENALLIPAAWARKPLPMANPQLARRNDMVVMEYLARFDGEALSERVRSELIERLASGEPSRADIAAALRLSEKTLQRRLQADQTTFQQLLDDVRRELALSYLRESRATVSDVTFRLGFSDQSSFTRAFRRWTGVTPGQFRTHAPLG